MRLLGQARLSPPAAPAEPGGFDFRRLAWFERLGAVGYARTPFLETAGGDDQRLPAADVPAPDGACRRTSRRGSRGRTARSPRRSSAATARRSRRRSNEELRLSTLYHIVSIGGLHMSLIAAAVFAIVRYGLALVPRLALVWPLKKIAAVASLAVTFAYLAVSGFDVAAQRAFMMLGGGAGGGDARPAGADHAVGGGRGARVLAVAPESLTLAGFQMSFAGDDRADRGLRGAARAGLVAGGRTRRRWRLRAAGAGGLRHLAGGRRGDRALSRPSTSTCSAQYGLLANLLAMPAMGLVVMPAAVVAMFLAPVGLDWLAFTVMGWGIGYVLAVAGWVAGLGGAAVGVPAGPAASLGLLSLGGLFLVLWSGRGRWAGLAPVAAGVVLWAAADRPDLLIADNGRLFGFRTAAGRVLSAPEGNGFAAESWLEDDGDLAGQAEAHARGGLERRRHRIEAGVPGLGRLVYVGSREAGEAEAECAAAAVLIAPNWERAPEGRCLFVGRERLARDGALAIRITGHGLAVEGARSRGRPWTGKAAPGAPPLRLAGGQPARPGLP